MCNSKRPLITAVSMSYHLIIPYQINHDAKCYSWTSIKQVFLCKTKFDQCLITLSSLEYSTVECCIFKKIEKTIITQTTYTFHLQETTTWRENLLKVSNSASLSQKNDFVFVDQIYYYKDLNQYAMANQIGFALFTDFKTNLSETQMYGDNF